MLVDTKDTVIETPITLFSERRDAERSARLFRALAISIAAHIVGLAFVVLAPVQWSPANRPVETMAEMRRRATPLVAPPPPPPQQLTQKEPNRGKISKEVDLESLLPRRAVQAPPGAPRPKAQPKRFDPPAPAPPIQASAPVISAEAPKIAAPGPSFGPPAANPSVGAPPPSQSQPKLAFETVPQPPNPPAAGMGRLAPPRNTVDDAVRDIARNPGGGSLAVGDVLESGGLQLPRPGRPGSRLELLSDPEGVDFRPYLLKVLQAVRRNWFAVIPESVKLGRRGRVVIQFAIDRQGRVPKLIIAMPSGAEALDRAAVAGISASNPLPPLPEEFKGDQVRLQFTFLYNMAGN